MSRLDRLFTRLRPHVPDEETRKAVKRTEQIHEQVLRQEPEAQRASAFALLVMRENELQPKIHRALRGS